MSLARIKSMEPTRPNTFSGLQTSNPQNPPIGLIQLTGQTNQIRTITLIIPITLIVSIILIGRTEPTSPNVQRIPPWRGNLNHPKIRKVELL